MSLVSVPLQSFKKGAIVWIADEECIWIDGHLSQSITPDSTQYSVVLKNAKVCNVPLKCAKDLPHLKNPDILIGRDDLTTLSYLHEPAVLHNLDYRFSTNQSIYTYCGIVLVAINPYHHCPHLYGDEVIQVYGGVGSQVRTLDPHIYAVAEEAYFDLKEYAKNQSIIVSGESGAGKTVSAKLAMKYFANVAGKGKGVNEGGIEDRVLASNPIMEAIGNARTIRNDNSSRFGKFIQINFNHKFNIAGAEMKTYLLEKSRVVYQTENERNYHIFYQICCARDEEILKGLHLDACPTFQYLLCEHVIPGVDDSREFLNTVEAMNILDFTIEEQRNIMQTFAAVLHIGNIQFEDNRGEPTGLQKSCDRTLSIVSNLLRVKEAALRDWLCKKEIHAANEIVIKNFDQLQAVTSRDALSKRLYSSVFNWIVSKINSSLRITTSPNKANRKETDNRFIGVLDIYGFETFQINSFEQFCINYANEKLQQQFNSHVFKLEQEEYVREGIDWIRIDFYDNQGCIDLIESRLGIIDLLDEQCKVGRGTDADWLQQMKGATSMKSAKDLVFPKIRNPSFIIKHFAADVNYQVEGFIDKNKDTVSDQLIDVLKDSQFPFLVELLYEPEEKKTSTIGKKASGMVRSVFGQGPTPQKQNKKSVASQFRDSLHSLMSVLMSTRPHYVRCIKPNDTKSAFTFDPHRAMQQLRACGVLETVRLSAAGYPSRWVYDEFARRYRVLYLGTRNPIWRDRPKEFAGLVCQRWIQDATTYALGHTKIFFRTGQVALLERVRSETLTKSAVSIQKTWRGYKDRKRFVRIRDSIRIIQATGRAFLAVRRLQYLRMERAVVCMQKWTRGYVQRSKYGRLKHIITHLQAAVRAKVIRGEVTKIRFEATVTHLQRYCRGHLVRQQFGHYIRKVVKVQCCVRKWLAKKKLRQLRIEAKSVNKLQSLNKGLENKIFELQYKLDTVMAEKATIETFATELQKRVGLLETAEAELKSVLVKLQEVYDIKASLEVELRSKNEELKRSKEDLVFAISEIEKRDKESDIQGTSAVKRNEVLEERLEKLNEEHAKLQEQLNLVQTNLYDKETELDSLQYLKEYILQETQEGRLPSEYSSPGLSRVNSMRLANGTPLNNLEHNRSFGSASTVNIMDDLTREREETLLILKLQDHLTRFRTENERLRGDNRKLKSYSELKTLLDRMAVKGSLQSYDQHRAQEAEVAYLKLRQEVDRMTAERAKFGLEGVNMQRLIESYMDEAERRREESVELRALLASKFETSTVNKVKGTKMDSNNNGRGLEEEICWERQCREQKKMIEDLMEQLEDRDGLVSELKAEVTDFKNTSRRTSLVPQNSNDSGLDEASVQGEMRNELHRLVSENMVLQTKLDKQNGVLSEARSNLREVITGRTQSTKAGGESRPLLLSARDVEHSGMIHVKDPIEFTRILVTDLKPRVAALIAPCLPSLMFCMALRHCDHLADDNYFANMFNSFHSGFKDTLNRTHDLDVLALWMVNSWRLLNLLRQYARVGDDQAEWKRENTEMQNGQVLGKLDMSPVREQLALRVKENYNYFMKRAVEPVLTPKIVPAILQHECAQGDVSQSSKSQNQRIQERALSDLTELMNFIHAKLRGFGADDVLVGQVYGQFIKWVCAYALNHLMFRRELCSFERAMQIKHNVQELSCWLSDKKMSHLNEHLEPLIQASHLLQSRKDDQYIDSLLGDLTNKLKPKQIVTLLRHYSPADGFEPEMDAEFLHKVGDRLVELRGVDLDSSPLLMVTHIQQFDTQPFVYTQTCIEKVTVPQCLRITDTVAELL